MNSIRFQYSFQLAGLGILAASGMMLAACGSDSSASAPPGSPVTGTGTGGAGVGGYVPGGGGAAVVPGGGGAPMGGAINPGGGGTPVVPGGGGTPMGGAVGNGGVVGNGGGVAVNPTDIKITGTVTQCANTTAGTLPAIAATTCTLPGCNNATCVPKTQVLSFAPTTDTTLLGTCGSADVLCVPNDYIATTGDFQTLKCNSLEGGEGRCISICVPQVSVQQTTLPKDNCGADELCAPCVNPINGTDTGACSQGCDTGADPNRPAVVFVECGGGLGICVPDSLVKDPVQLAALKAVDDPTGKCADTTKVCAPKLKANDQSANFAPCTMTSAAALLATMRNSTGQLAACVPKYIVPTGQQGLLLQDGCQTNELCAPCFSPLSTPPNAPTGACPP